MMKGETGYPVSFFLFCNGLAYPNENMKKADAAFLLENGICLFL
jgi:hypothetical protein